MRVLVTGGTGFIGRGILRRFANEWDITVFSRDEQKQDLCRQRWPNVTYKLGDVTDLQCITQACKNQDLVIHTAAIKFIPEAEHNVRETIRINVGGTDNVLRACDASGSRVVVLSTDKACAPLNTYGMTKALCERLVGEYARQDVQCTAVRYGNVVGSTGSVIPLFQRQLKTQGYVTITDRAMTRFWVSVDQAIDLVLEAADHTQCGDVVIPKPASMSIGEIADLLVEAYGPIEKVEGRQSVKITGLRPGEKMHEALLDVAESVRAEDVGQYYHLKPAWHEPVRTDGFVLSSNCPPILLSSRWMLDTIMNAELV